MGRGLCCIKKEGKKIKTEEKIEGDFSCQHNYSTAGLEAQREKYFEALQAWYRQLFAFVWSREKYFVTCLSHVTTLEKLMK